MSNQIRSPYNFEAILPASTEDIKTIIELLREQNRETQLQRELLSKLVTHLISSPRKDSSGPAGEELYSKGDAEDRYDDSGIKHNSDSPEDLKYLYWIRGYSPTQIMYKISYSTPFDVINKLKEHNIPLRPIDTAKEIIEIQKQSDNSTNLRGSILDANGETVTTETIDIRDYNRFQGFISYGETGTATGSTLLITAQFSLDGATWYDYEEGPWGFPIESSATIPRNFVITGICMANYLRFVFTATLGTTLNATNYFTIEALYIGVG